jgi:hypothetical protein
MNTTSREWAELEYLSAHIGKLHSRYQAARAMASISKCFGAIKTIELEIAETTAMRDVLVSRLSDRVADQIVAPAAMPAEANS